MICCFEAICIFQDWCVAAQAVPLGGSAGLLRCPLGQHACQPTGATACFRLHRHTLWPHGVTASANSHARPRPQTCGEFCTLSCLSSSKRQKLQFDINFFFLQQVKSVYLSLQDSNLLVQRNMLEILLYFFPFAEVLVGKHLLDDLSPQTNRILRAIDNNTDFLWRAVMVQFWLYSFSITGPANIKMF